MKFKKFSDELEYWIKNDDTKTLGELVDIFGEKSFGIFFLAMLSVSALPIPTGGVTTFVLLPAAIIAGLEMAIGRRTLWLPNFIRNQPLDGKIATKSYPFIIKRVRSIERISKPRLAHLLKTKIFRAVIGILVAVLAAASIIAPPFSGFDTLPSMGGVFIALAIIFDDYVMALIGILLGILGIGLMFLAAGAIILFLQTVF